MLVVLIDGHYGNQLILNLASFFSYFSVVPQTHQLTSVSLIEEPEMLVRTKMAQFLKGVTYDLLNMEKAVGSKLFNTVKDLYLTKSEALAKIGNIFEACKSKKFKPLLYYTGHGEIGTGNWCFHDGTISIQEIFDMLPGGVYYPMIFSDACYSGHWANFCINKGMPGFDCLAACPEYKKAFDTAGT